MDTAGTSASAQPGSSSEPPRLATLQAACARAVFANPPDDLDNMPAHVLAQLLRQSSAQQLATELRLETELQAARAQVEHLLEKQHDRYIVDLPVSQDRVDQEKSDQARAAAAKWEPVEEQPFDSAPLPAGMKQQTLLYDRVAGKFALCQGSSEYDYMAVAWLQQQQGAKSGPGSVCSLWNVISSALLLYRLHCLFDVPPVQLQDSYKAVWGVSLVHKASGRVLDLGEHKGAARHYAKLYEPDPSGFTADVLELLNVLCDPECPHPYDGCVAGCVA